MSNEIKHAEAQELSVQELDAVAGGNSLDQILAKDFDAVFNQQSTKDVRFNQVGPNGAVSFEATQLDQTKTVLNNDLFAAQGDF